MSQKRLTLRLPYRDATKNISHTQKWGHMYLKKILSLARNDKKRNRHADILLTVFIPFMNENEEVIATVADVRRTVGRHVDILVVNDGSTDGRTQRL